MVNVHNNEMSELNENKRKIPNNISTVVHRQNWVFKENGVNMDSADLQPKGLVINSKRARRNNSWKEFCQTTSIHGLVRLVDPSQPVWMRLLWSLIVVTLFIILLVIISTISIRNIGNRNIYSSLTVASNHSLTFPDIHICDSSYFSRQRLQDMEFNETMGNYLIASLSTLLMADTFVLNKQLNLLFDRSLDELLHPYDDNIYTVVIKAALRCEEMIAGCIHMNRRFNSSACCAEFFNEKKQLNPFGSCVTTSGKISLYEIVPTNLRGFTVMVKMNQDRINLDPDIVAPGLTEKSGIVVSVSHPTVGLYGALFNGAEYVSPGTAAMIGLSVTKTDNSAMKNSPLAPNDCAFEYEYPDLVKGFHSYSKANCQSTAIQAAYNEWFNCTIISIEKINDNLPNCLPKYFSSNKSNFIDFSERVKQRGCMCVEDCISIKYSMDITSGKLVLNSGSLKYYGNYSMEQMASLHFFFSSLSYSVITNQPESLLKWLSIINISCSDVGGIMGLYMGASLISILEISTFLIRWLLSL